MLEAGEACGLRKAAGGHPGRRRARCAAAARSLRANDLPDLVQLPALARRGTSRGDLVRGTARLGDGSLPVRAAICRAGAQRRTPLLWRFRITRGRLQGAHGGSQRPQHRSGAVPLGAGRVASVDGAIAHRRSSPEESSRGPRKNRRAAAPWTDASLFPGHPCRAVRFASFRVRPASPPGPSERQIHIELTGSGGSVLGLLRDSRRPL
jgi:hypothetical protein